MKKISVDGKEFEVTINKSKQLSDAELEGVQGGGELPSGTVLYARICCKCGWSSGYCTKFKALEILGGGHRQIAEHSAFY